jgi:S1-C subfamily serine protease
MRTDDVGRIPADRDDPPGSLDEALGRQGADGDVRSLWDDLAETPAQPADPSARGTATDQANAEPLADRLLVAPEAAPPAPTDLPPTPVTDRPGTRPAEADGEVSPPSWRERRDERRRAKSAQRNDKERRRSNRLELRRHRILPRTVIGISMLLLAAAVGAAISGAGLYAYYDWRLSENEDRVGTLTATLEERLTEANADIENVQTQAVNNIREAAAPLEQILADTRTVSDLTPVLAPSVFFISTLDSDGAPSVGSGFVVSSDDSESLIVTSYRTVAAVTETPAPGIEVRGEGGTLTGRLHSWDPDRDLALLIVDEGGLTPLAWAPDSVRAEALGRRVYIAGGLGGAGVSLSPGLVIDQSESGIQHSAPVGNAWQGGPLLTAEGEVLGIASIAYAPLGFDPGGLPFAVPVEGACERVLTCSGGDVTG